MSLHWVKSFQRRLLVGLLLAAFWHMSATCQTETPMSRARPQPGSAPNTVALGPGDTIAIAALGEEELSKRWTVSQTGDLYLPYLGRVPAAGKTVAELERDLAERFKQYLHNPMLTVTVAELRSRPVTISGAVRNPGIYQIEGGVTLYQALALAGGVDQAGSTLTLTRQRGSGSINLPGAKWVNDGAEMLISLNLKEVLRAEGPVAGLEIRPHDVIGIERNRERLVYIAGEVNMPGAIQLETVNSLFVTQALAMAGGYKSTARLDKAIIWSCCDAERKARMTWVSVKNILEGKEEDRKIKEGDYLMIPPKSQRNIMANMATFAALASASGTLAVIGLR